jgi:hypothetical protein
MLVQPAQVMPTCDAEERFAAMVALHLPPTVCSVKSLGIANGQNISTTGADIAGSIFIQQGTQVVDPSRFKATFSGLALYAPPGYAYTLELSCAMSSIAIPPAIVHSVFVSGCAAGYERRGVFCSKCGTGQFSMGTEDHRQRYHICKAAPWREAV